MLRKKYSFSLLEILIGFVLAGILFGCIFSNFSQSYKTQKRMETAHAAMVNREGAFLQLRSLLARLPSSLEDKKEKEETPAPLYTAGLSGEKGAGALWFSLVADYDSDPRFIGPLDFCLHHEAKKKALLLTIHNGQKEEKVEEVMRNVKSWTISLFDPEKGAWVHTWPKNANSLPTMLKLEIVESGRKKKSAPVEFAFVLPSSRQPIVFEEP